MHLRQNILYKSHAFPNTGKFVMVLKLCEIPHIKFPSPVYNIVNIGAVAVQMMMGLRICCLSYCQFILYSIAIIKFLSFDSSFTSIISKISEIFSSIITITCFFSKPASTEITFLYLTSLKYS